MGARWLTLFRREPSLTQEHFVEHWLEQHAPLVAARPGTRASRINPLVGAPDGFSWHGIAGCG
jgi:EthD domain